MSIPSRIQKPPKIVKFLLMRLESSLVDFLLRAIFVLAKFIGSAVSSKLGAIQYDFFRAQHVVHRGGSFVVLGLDLILVIGERSLDIGLIQILHPALGLIYRGSSLIECIVPPAITPMLGMPPWPSKLCASLEIKLKH